MKLTASMLLGNLLLEHWKSSGLSMEGHLLCLKFYLSPTLTFDHSNNSRLQYIQFDLSSGVCACVHVSQG